MNDIEFNEWLLKVCEEDIEWCQRILLKMKDSKTRQIINQDITLSYEIKDKCFDRLNTLKN